jgi:hypothetical protein
MREITQKEFYQVGFYTFIVVAFCMIANFFIFYEINNVFAKISQIATLIFDIALILLFKRMLGEAERAENMLKLMEAQINEKSDVKDIVKKIKNLKEVQKQ